MNFDVFLNRLAPSLETNTDPIVGISEALLAAGVQTGAQNVLQAGIRSNWTKALYWSRLTGIIKSPEDYLHTRQLWLEAPDKVRTQIPILRAVARAACMCGNQTEGRLLLRKACLLAEPQFNGASTADNFKSRAAKALSDMRAEFDKVELKPFLVSGTLLGMVREGEIISWDKDVDVGVFAEERALSAFEQSVWGGEMFTIRKLDLGSNRIRMVHRNGVGIDVFPHYPDSSGARVWHDGAATRWWNSPFDLKTATFLGVDHFVPADPELYLDENYGNWKVPDPNFDARLDAPNVEVTNREYFDSLLYFSLLDTITQNKKQKRQRYIQLISEFDDATWIDRLK
jgi:hypothetical protein